MTSTALLSRHGLRLDANSDRKREDDEWMLLLAFWRLHSDAKYAGLLSGYGWTWKPAKQTYVDNSGDAMTRAQLKALAISFEESVKAGLQERPTTDVDQWQADATRDVSSEYVLLAALAAGGLANLTSADRAVVTGAVSEGSRVGSGTLDATARLDNFADAIRTGTPSPAQIRTRVGSYASGGYPIYEKVRQNSFRRARNGAGEAIYLTERNVLDATAEHCESKYPVIGCVEASEMGDQPIGTIPTPGWRVCGQKCKCHMEYGAKHGSAFVLSRHALRLSADDADGHWVTISGVHVEIRGGVVVKGPSALMGKSHEQLTANGHAPERKISADDAAKMKPGAKKTVPAAAIKAYEKYHGNEDKAWEAEDEQASMLIGMHGDAIRAGATAAPQVHQEFAPDSQVSVHGDTFKHKDALKKAGFKWNSDIKAWVGKRNLIDDPSKYPGITLHQYDPEGAARSKAYNDSLRQATENAAKQKSMTEAAAAKKKAGDQAALNERMHNNHMDEMKANIPKAEKELKEFVARGHTWDDDGKQVGSDHPIFKGDVASKEKSIASMKSKVAEHEKKFGDAVQHAADTSPTGKFGDNKVFINHVHAQFQKDTGSAMPLGEFKGKLNESAQTGHIRVSRADLPQAMNADDVKASETTRLNQTSHFVQTSATEPKSFNTSKQLDFSGREVGELTGKQNTMFADAKEAAKPKPLGSKNVNNPKHTPSLFSRSPFAARRALTLSSLFGETTGGSQGSLFEGHWVTIDGRHIYLPGPKGSPANKEAIKESFEKVKDNKVSEEHAGHVTVGVHSEKPVEAKTPEAEKANELKPHAVSVTHEGEPLHVGTLPTRPIAQLVADHVATKNNESPTAVQNSRLVTARSDLTKPADLSVLSDELKKHLAPHQQEAAAKAISAMDKHGGFLLASGTGAGKTRSELAVAATHAANGKKVLLVTKKEVIKPDWKKGTITGSVKNDGDAMGIPVTLNDGTKPLEAGKVHATTYDRLADIKKHVDKNTTIIYDESHALKNYSSQRAEHGREMGRAAGSVMYATATPADEPMHIGHLERAKVFGGKHPFGTFEELGMKQESVHTPHGSVKKWVPDKKVNAKERVRRMSGLFDRMTDEGLMVKHELSMKGVDVGMEHVALPAEAHAKMRDIENNLPDPHQRAQMLMAQRIQQEPYKVPHVVKMVKEDIAAGRRPIVFASRVNESDAGGDEGEGSEGTMKLLKDALAKEGISDVSELHGNASNPAKHVADFQSGKNRVMLATVQSGGTGINLDDTKGDAPRSVTMMTAPFSAVDNMQAIGRVWRMKTASNPKIRYVMGDTDVDKWNGGLVARKMKTLGAAVSGEAQNFKPLDEETASAGGWDSSEGQAPYQWRSLTGASQPSSPAASSAPASSPIVTAPQNSSSKTVFLRGNTFAHKETIKKAGFRWHPDKKAWYGGSHLMPNLPRGVTAAEFSRQRWFVLSPAARRAGKVLALDADLGGRWVTIEHEHVFIRDGAGHIPLRLHAGDGADRFTKTALRSKLISHHNETTGGSYTAHDEKTLNAAAGAGDAFTFHKKLPGEIKGAIESNPALRSMFHVTDDTRKAGGADAFGELGDRYIKMAEAKAGSPLKAALETAHKSNDPEIKLLAHIHDNLPAGKTSADTIKAGGLRVGDEFKTNGSKFRVAEDEHGLRVLHSHEYGHLTPVDAVSHLPIDKGSFRPGKRPRFTAKVNAPFSRKFRVSPHFLALGSGVR